MSANVETMACTGLVPWHGQGEVAEEGLTAVQMMAPAEIMWKVMLQKMYINSGTHGKPLEVPGYRALVRETDKQIYTVVGSRYRPIQNLDGAEMADDIAAALDGAYCNTAGSLLGGKLVWFQIKLPGEFTVPGDTSPVEKYVLVSVPHDGMSAMMAMFTDVRVVCNNTYNMALRGATNLVKIRHTASAKERMELAAEAMREALGYHEEFESLATALATTKFTDVQMDNLAATLIPDTGAKAGTKKAEVTKTDAGYSAWTPQDGSVVSQILDGYATLPGEQGRAAEEDVEVSATVQKKRDTMVSLFTTGKGITSGIRGTAWAAANAVTEYVDHHIPVKAKKAVKNDKRTYNAIFGNGAKIKQQGLETILKLVDLN